jgi:hypothetical protein
MKRQGGIRLPDGRLPPATMLASGCGRPQKKRWSRVIATTHKYWSRVETYHPTTQYRAEARRGRAADLQDGAPHIHKAGGQGPVLRADGHPPREAQVPVQPRVPQPSAIRRHTDLLVPHRPRCGIGLHLYNTTSM